MRKQHGIKTRSPQCTYALVWRRSNIFFCVLGSVVKLIFYSHSGIVESDEIDLQTQSHLSADFLSLMVTSSPPDLGYNSMTGFFDPFNAYEAKTLRVSTELEPIGLEENNQSSPPVLHMPALGEKVMSGRVWLDEEPRNTVYRIDIPEYTPNLVLKYRWQLISQRCEVEASK